MAKLLVRPHDLQQACADCGMTLETLAEETGLAEDVLLAFAAGRIALSAADRLAILGVLVRHAPSAKPPSEPMRLASSYHWVLIRR